MTAQDELIEALRPCPFCGGPMMERHALWPSEGDTDAIIHATPTECALSDFSLGTADEGVSVKAAWNRRAALASASASSTEERPERVAAAFATWRDRPETGPNAVAMFQYIEELESRLRALSSRATAMPVSNGDGNRPLPIDRETLGRMVREAWVRWAKTQPAPKPSWLAPYDDLSEPDKEADRQIGEAIARWTIIHLAAESALTAPTHRDEIMAQKIADEEAEEERRNNGQFGVGA